MKLKYMNSINEDMRTLKLKGFNAKTIPIVTELFPQNLGFGSGYG